MLVREARPEDVEAAVPLIHSAGPDAFNYVFSVPAGPSTADFLRAAFLSGDGQFGWRNHAVAEHEGEVVGIAAAWGADNTLRFSLAALRQLVHVYGWVRAWSVAVRGLRTEAVIRPPRPGCLYIADLGVAPTCRGQGIGRALIDWLGERGRRRYPTLALDVAVNNPRAQALYERLGFRLVAERPSRLSNAQGFVPASRYMERPNT